jgi:hypothetical protein
MPYTYRLIALGPARSLTLGGGGFIPEDVGAHRFDPL